LEQQNNYWCTYYLYEKIYNIIYYNSKTHITQRFTSSFANGIVTLKNGANLQIKFEWYGPNNNKLWKNPHNETKINYKLN